MRRSRFALWPSSSQRLVCLLAAALLLSACSVHVFSPPGGGAPVESSATVGKGRYAVRGDIAVGSAVWGPTVSAYRLSATRGLTSKFDVMLAPSVIRVHPPDPGNPHGGIYSLRAGVKYAPVRYVALSSGFAPGGSVGGPYLAHDAGFILGGENPYLVPFLSFHGVLSTPLQAKTVRVVYVDEDDEGYEYYDENDEHQVYTPTTAYYRKPLFTYGWQGSLGLKLPLRHVQAPVMPSLTCALGFTMLFTKRAGDLFSTFGCGLDATFGR